MGVASGPGASLDGTAQNTREPDGGVLFPAETGLATTTTSRPCRGTVTTGKQSPGQGPPSTTSSTFASLWRLSLARVRGPSRVAGLWSVWCIPLCDTGGLAGKPQEEGLRVSVTGPWCGPGQIGAEGSVGTSQPVLSVRRWRGAGASRVAAGSPLQDGDERL